MLVIRTCANARVNERQERERAGTKFTDLGTGLVQGHFDVSHVTENSMRVKDSAIDTGREPFSPRLENIMGLAMLVGALVLFPSPGVWTEEVYIVARSTAFPLALTCGFWALKCRKIQWVIFAILGMLSFNPISPILGNESWDAFGGFFSIGFGVLALHLLNTETSKFSSFLFGSVGAVLICLTVYVNYNMPRGPKYYTGEIVCMNDGRGPCGEEMREDLSELDIPLWAKFLRQNLMWTLLFFAFSTSLLHLKGKQNGLPDD